MLNNKSFAPGLLAGSKEYSYHATKVAKELLMYVSLPAISMFLRSMYSCAATTAIIFSCM